jgi:hypothetical protein
MNGGDRQQNVDMTWLSDQQVVYAAATRDADSLPTFRPLPT